MKQRHDHGEKPYHKCLTCPRFRNSCGGLPTRGMTLQEWCEYMRDVKDFAHLTNAYIADAADVSIKTIERIMAINIDQDIMRATARRIELVVIGQVGDYTCNQNDGGAERIAKLLEVIDYLRLDLERKNKIIDDYLNRKGK